MPLSSSLLTVVERGKELVDKAKRLRLLRAIARYGNEKGAVLSGGIAYSSVFSMASALAIGLTVFAKLLGRNETLKLSLYKSIDQILPGVLSWRGHKGMIDPDSMVISLSYSLTGIVALIILLFSASNVMYCMKMAIRAMFGLGPSTRNVVMDKIFDLLGFAFLSLGVLVTGILSTANHWFGAKITGYLGWNTGTSTIAISALTLMLCVLVDALVLWLLVEVVSQVKVLPKDLFWGLLLYAGSSAVVRSAGTSLLSSSNNKILMSFAALAFLLLWTNLLARMVLYAAAYMANPPAIDRPQMVVDRHAQERPNFITLSVPETLSWSDEIPEVPVEEDLEIAGVLNEDDANPGKKGTISRRGNRQGRNSDATPLPNVIRMMAWIATAIVAPMILRNITGLGKRVLGRGHKRTQLTAECTQKLTTDK